MDISVACNTFKEKEIKVKVERERERVVVVVTAINGKEHKEFHNMGEGIGDSNNV